MHLRIGRSLLALGSGAALVLTLAGCGGPAKPSGTTNQASALEIRPVLAVANDMPDASVTDAERTALLALDCDGAAATPSPTITGSQLMACDEYGEGYLLGPAEINGADIAEASAARVPTGSAEEWGVTLVLDEPGAERLADLTERLLVYPLDDPRNRLAMVLDGRVISAPAIAARIADGRMQILGEFTEESADALANRLGAG